MADNVTLNSMTGGSDVATDDIGGAHYQRIKLVHGADGTNDGDVSTANPLPVASVGGTSTITTQNDQTSSATLLSANSDRKKFIIVNDSTADLYVKYGTTATSDSYTWLLKPAAVLEEWHYTGRVDGIWASNASGKARVTEID